MRLAAQRKVNSYRQQYADNQNISFLPAIMTTSPFTQHPCPSRALVRDGHTSPHMPRLVVPHGTCPPLSPSPHANSFVIGTVVINTHTHTPFATRMQILGSLNRTWTARSFEPQLTATAILRGVTSVEGSKEGRKVWGDSHEFNPFEASTTSPRYVVSYK